MSATGDDIGGTGTRGDDPRVLERRSDRIRADMNQTLDALQSQYSPGALLDRGVGLFREHGGEIGANLGRSIRENPMPALLTLVGVGWMILSTQKDSGAARHGGTAETYGGMDSVRAGYADDAAGAAHAAGDRLRDAKDSLADSMSAGRERLAERGSALADGARERGERAQQGFARMMEEQPLVVGALGIAVGALLGALIPESDRERQLLGETSRKARDKAMELGSQGYEAARETATKAAAAVGEATREDREALKAKVGAGNPASGGTLQ